MKIEFGFCVAQGAPALPYSIQWDRVGKIGLQPFGSLRRLVNVHIIMTMQFCNEKRTKNSFLIQYLILDSSRQGQKNNKRRYSFVANTLI